MKILFMGTPDFAAESLKALIDSKNHEIVGVVSQPDKPKGRGKKVQPTDVKVVALEENLPIFQPTTLKNDSFLDELKALDPDIIVVVAYGQILPEYILSYPKYGCINVHGSLLPKYRGAAPIQRAVIDGEKYTGVTTMYMDKTLDTGDIILKSETEIGENETAGELFDRLAKMGGELLVKTLGEIENGTAPREKQDDTKATYAHMLNKDTGKIEWSKSAKEIVDLIRGTNPWPVAFTEYKGELMKVYSAKVCEGYKNATCGTIVSADKKGIAVVCGDDKCVLIDEIQFKGKKRMSVMSYLNGHAIDEGEVLR